MMDTPKDATEVAVISSPLLDALIALRDAARRLCETTIYHEGRNVQDARERTLAAIHASEKLVPPLGLDTTLDSSNAKLRHSPSERKP